MAKFIKIHDHLKAHMKKALIQVSVGGDGPSEFALMVNVGKSDGLLKLSIPEAISERPQDLKEKMDFIARNVSFGNTFMFSRELFCQNVVEASIRFYRRGADNQNFMASELNYSDSGTKTHHRSVMDDWNCKLATWPVRSLLGKVVLSNKTSTGLQRWAKSIKVKDAKQSVVIIFNKTLNVVVLSVDETASKTLDFNQIPGAPSDLNVVEKQEDVGCLLCDASFSVSLDAFITAVGACKISGMSNVGLMVYDSQVLGIEAVPLKQHTHIMGRLNILLLDRSDKELESQFGAAQNPQTEQIVPSLPPTGESRKRSWSVTSETTSIKVLEAGGESEVEAAVQSILVEDSDGRKTSEEPSAKKKKSHHHHQTRAESRSSKSRKQQQRPIFVPLV